MRDADDMLCDDEDTFEPDGSPTIATLQRWSREGDMEAIDGCGPVEDDGYCEHGKPSWMRSMGLI